VRQVPEVAEFRSTVSTDESLRALRIEVELAPGGGDGDAVAHRVAQVVRQALGLTVPVRPVPTGTLPRFELKARRFVVEGEAADRSQETGDRRQEGAP